MRPSTRVLLWRGVRERADLDSADLHLRFASFFAQAARPKLRVKRRALSHTVRAPGEPRGRVGSVTRTHGSVSVAMEPPTPPVAAPSGAHARLLFKCQACAAVLDVTDGADGSTAPGRHGDTGSSQGGGVDESWVLPEGARGGKPGVVGASPPGGAAPHLSAGSSSRGNMAESFVVLPSSVSRVPRDVGGHGIDARCAAMAKVFDMASDESKIDLPMCLECAASLREELELRIKETQAECEMYARCLETLGGAEGGAEGGADANTAVRQRGAFTPREKEEAETRKVEAELRAELTKAADLRLELDDLRGERLGLQAESNDLDARESAYWDDFNDFKLALERHVDERDSLVVSVEQTGRQLERLRRTNVFNDAFHVWFDGPFGTVNGFRLGRLPNVAVEWDEINAAWGMTCLLLSTMANAVKLEFTQYTLQPMGSFSKVLDKKGEFIFCSLTVCPYELCFFQATRTNCTGR
jgi:beclin 1